MIWYLRHHLQVHVLREMAPVVSAFDVLQKHLSFPWSSKCQPRAGDPEPDPVTAALAKITSHIGSARKVPKAAGLLRQLLASGTLTAQHGPAVFAALRAAMAEPARVSMSLLTQGQRCLLPKPVNKSTKLSTSAFKFGTPLLSNSHLALC